MDQQVHTYACIHTIIHSNAQTKMVILSDNNEECLKRYKGAGYGCGWCTKLKFLNGDWVQGQIKTIKLVPLHTVN
jgi:hypothetical protein